MDTPRPEDLHERLSQLLPAPELPHAAQVMVRYPIGTPEHEVVYRAQRHEPLSTVFAAHARAYRACETDELLMKHERQTQLAYHHGGMCSAAMALIWPLGGRWTIQTAVGRAVSALYECVTGEYWADTDPLPVDFPPATTILFAFPVPQ